VTPPRLVLADGPDGPLPDPAEIAAIAGLAEPEVVVGWVVRQPGWLETNSLPVTTVLVGPGTRAAVASGRVRAEAVRLSAVPGLLRGRMRPTVAVVGAFADGAGWRLAGSPGWAAAAALHADEVIVERWPGPPPPRAPVLEATVTGVIDRREPPDPPPDHQPNRADRLVGEMVAELVPESATVQWGPGVIGASVVAALKAPVRVWSGLVTDELADLADRGLLLDTAVAAYTWGGARLSALVGDGRLVLHPVAHTHDLTAISAIPRFVAINTALQVGLDGSANVEMVGGRIVAGPGGHPDFAAGASRSPGGLSIVALPSTSGSRSTIVARPDVVTTPRFDVDVVVTEHGVADLRGCDQGQRAHRLAQIADPEHRERLL
jgi:Acetyl-CoA hydrolase/transferase C-terminal domain